MRALAVTEVLSRPLTIPLAATAVPQPPGTSNPDGSIVYLCSGRNEFGKPCGKFLGVWRPPDGAGPGDYGRFEEKCRRCKTLCHCRHVVEPA